VGLLRICVVFLLGVGAALGAYATGTLDYISRQHFFHSWYEPASEHGLILRVSGNALNDHCTARYAVDNRTGRHVFVVFAPEDGPLDAHLASYDRPDEQQVSYGDDQPVDDRGAYGADAEEFRPADGQYGSDEYRGDDRTVDAAHDYPADVARNDAPPPVEVAPGEEKVLGREGEIADGLGYGTAAAPCGDRVVKLRITDCAAADRACVRLNSAGGASPQGDE
jgi:hypothetical protein